MSDPQHAAFVDKDGTLIEDVPYNVDPALVRLTPGAADAVALLARHGFCVIVVSNQPGIAHGLFDESTLRAVENRVRALLEPAGAAVDAFYYCPHAPDTSRRGACACRKPRPGLLRRAAAERNIDLGASWLVGDILDDVEAGRRAGCRAILLANGHETEWRLTPERAPDRIATDLFEAAHMIVAPRLRVGVEDAHAERVG